MRRFLIFMALLTINVVASYAAPVNGWYAHVFGGYASVSDNLHVTSAGVTYTQTAYKPGYNIGGSLGLQKNALRYAGDIFYLDANLKNFTADRTPQTNISGYSNAIVAMANIYYDFNDIVSNLQPFLGGGLGYAQTHTQLNSTGPSGVNQYSDSNNGFAYQVLLGMNLNVSKIYTINLGWRYVATTRASIPGKSFRPYLQAYPISLGFIYRFDSCNTSC